MNAEEQENIIVTNTIKQYFPDVDIEGVVSLETLDIFYENLLEKHEDHFKFYLDEYISKLHWIPDDISYDCFKVMILKSLYKDFVIDDYERFHKNVNIDYAKRLCDLSREFILLKEVKRYEEGKLTKKGILKQYANRYSEIIDCDYFIKNAEEYAYLRFKSLYILSHDCPQYHDIGSKIFNMYTWCIRKRIFEDKEERFEKVLEKYKWLKKVTEGIPYE